MDELTHIYLTEAIMAEIELLRVRIARADGLAESKTQTEETRKYMATHVVSMKECIEELRRHMRSTRPPSVA